MKKRVLYLVTTVCLLLALCPVTAFAAGRYEISASAGGTHVFIVNL